jgi:hypothetical protein
VKGRGVHSTSTYYEYRGSVDGVGNAVDDGILLICTMVRIRIFSWLKQNVPVPTQTYTYGAKEIWFREKRSQSPSMAHQDKTINQKIAGTFHARFGDDCTNLQP